MEVYKEVCMGVCMEVHRGAQRCAQRCMEVHRGVYRGAQRWGKKSRFYDNWVGQC